MRDNLPRGGTLGCQSLTVSKTGDFWWTHTDMRVFGAERVLLASAGKTRRKRMSEICFLPKRVSDVQAKGALLIDSPATSKAFRSAAGFWFTQRRGSLLIVQ